MSRAKYLIPSIMGEPGRELYVVRGDIPKGQKLILARKLFSRMVNDQDQKYIDKLLGPYDRRPDRAQGVETLSFDNKDRVSVKEAVLIHGYITNTLPGAYRAPELSQWYIYERPGDIGPLKLARFSINLLSTDERKALLSIIDQIRVEAKSLPDISEYQ